MLLKNHSYSERSNWVELFTSFGVLYYYLTRISSLPGNLEANPSEFGSLIFNIIVISIVLSIIYSIIFGLGDEKNSSKEDERDIMIRRKATSWAYWIMNIGIVYLVVQLFINIYIRLNVKGDLGDIGLFISLPSIDFMLHGLILLGFITQIAQNLLEIFFQRRGF